LKQKVLQRRLYRLIVAGKTEFPTLSGNYGLSGYVKSGGEGELRLFAEGNLRDDNGLNGWERGFFGQEGTRMTMD